jgi:hypothetical protein
LNNSSQPSHRQTANFVLLSQEVDKKLLSFSQLRFDAAWPAILVVNPKCEGVSIRLNKNHLSEDPALAVCPARFDVSNP